MKDSWANDASETIQLNRWPGAYLVLAMFYTSCRAICPMTVGRMKLIEKKIERGPAVQYILFSIDPENDKPETLKQFRRAQGIERANWHLLRSTVEQSRKLAAALSVGFSDKPGNVELHQMHSRQLIVVSPEGDILLASQSEDEVVKILKNHKPR